MWRLVFGVGGMRRMFGRLGEGDCGFWSFLAFLKKSRCIFVLVWWSRFAGVFLVGLVWRNWFGGAFLVGDCLGACFWFRLV